MKPTKFNDEINRFDPEIPVEKALTPPSSWYTESEFLKYEAQTVFNNSWLYVGYTEQIVSPGDYFSGHFLGQPYLVVCDQKGKIKAFYNVCRHHATCVANEAGNTKKFICPYHGWSYKLDGSLHHAPRVDGIEDFAKKDYGLIPIPVTIWGPFIFLYFGDSPYSLDDDLAPLKKQLNATEFANLRFVKRVSYELKCNWKVFVDNYLDGGYHVAYLHKGLAGQLNLKDYNTEIFKRFSVQACSARKSSSGKKSKDFAERVAGGAVYAWLYPNLMINRYGPIMDINWVIPVSYEKTITVFDYFFDESCDQDFIDKSLVASDIVQQEDIDICESVQRGLASRAYDCGRYAPAFEKPALHFHQLLSEDLHRIRTT